MNGSKEPVLLVDDDPDLLRLLTLRLSSAGYSVATATNGQEALARLAVTRPRVVITDLRMDGMDGMSLFDAIKRQQPTLPTIILTAHGTIPDAISAINRGVFSFLTKPFDGKELLAHVAKAVDVASAATPAPQADDEWRADIVTQSAVMEDLLNQAKLVAQSDSSILIQGASGTGKEVLARAIHRASTRREQPFVAINCGAIPESLLESELFGSQRGSFTGATQNREGLIQAAHGGTLFLDEIGDMPVSLQAKLLRVLQDKQVRPLGSTKSLPVDTRIISATHQDLDAAIKANTFRDDLYYRLNVVSLEIPPLSMRREDIPLLADHYVHKIAARNKRSARGFTADALELLIKAPWPGNVRQLINVIEQVVILCATPLIPASLVQKALRQRPSEVLSLREARSRFEQNYLIQLLRMTNGNVSQAARLAKRNRTEFYKLLHRHQLDPTAFKCK